MFLSSVALFPSVVTHEVLDLWESFQYYVGAQADVRLATRGGARYKVSAHGQEHWTALKRFYWIFSLGESCAKCSLETAGK